MLNNNDDWNDEEFQLWMSANHSSEPRNKLQGAKFSSSSITLHCDVAPVLCCAVRDSWKHRYLYIKSGFNSVSIYWILLPKPLHF